MDIRIYYNSLSNNGRGEECLQALKLRFPADNLIACDITKVDDIKKEIDSVPADDKVVICGGDGTLNRFINTYDPAGLKRDIWYYPIGSGNDFMNDLNKTVDDCPFVINDYIKNLPEVHVNGKTYKFINNVGFGIDGYACEEADRVRALSKKKKINYTKIALRGFMGAYSPANAVVVVDGVRKEYKDVWLASAMKGRYCGGGMMLAPSQDRSDPNNTITVPIVHGHSKFKMLRRFSSVFKGTHEKYTDICDFFSAHEVEVTFDGPCALQIDGETVLGVYRYSASTSHRPDENSYFQNFQSEFPG